MLVAITLENYALASALEINFEQGFNVITGETGAGKSLILDALALSMGARADATKVRHGAQKAEIYVEFDISDNQAAFSDWFAQQSATMTEQLLIRRQILASGRSKAWLNGQPISLAELKTLGEKLVQMHSQHAQTALLKPSYMLGWLDTAADTKLQTATLKDSMNTAWQAYQKLAKQVSESQAQSAARMERMRLLRMQLEDVSYIAETDYTSLEKEHETLSNYEQLMREASSLLGLLEADEVSISQLLAQSVRIAEQQSQENFSHVAAHLHTATAEVEEAIAYMREFAEKPTPDAHKLQQLDQQLSDFHRLARKYHTKPQDLTTLSQSWADELLTLEGLADDESNQAQLAALKQRFLEAANALDTARKKAAPMLCDQLLGKLKPLALENAQCEFHFTPIDEPNAKGVSDIQFMFSANKGMPLQPLHKQASGGELSRLALVMQVLNAHAQQQVLLVFDEIDVGMSGGTAEVIGELMQNLGGTQQILSITHQAQVAAKADHHLLVTKQDIGEQTHSNISSIYEDERVHELARMSGGVEITDSTLAHARSLLGGLDN